MEVMSRHPLLGRLKRYLTESVPVSRRAIVSLRPQPDLIGFPTAGDTAVPPPWLLDLFGPEQTRVSAAKARSVLHWTPCVEILEGQQKTVEWAQDTRLWPSA